MNDNTTIFKEGANEMSHHTERLVDMIVDAYKKFITPFIDKKAHKIWLGCCIWLCMERRWN